MVGKPKLEDLRAAPYNPRKISAKAKKGLAKSLEDFGDLSGITWNEHTGHLVSGHQRVDLLNRMGATYEGGAFELGGGRFLVRVVDWDDAKEMRANLSANNEHIGGTFTDDLSDILAVVKEDIPLPEFEELRFDALLAPIPGTRHVEFDAKIDTEPKPPKVATTQPGDVWELGRHTLVCGDNRDPSLWVEGEMLFTDPPYGVDYCGGHFHSGDVTIKRERERLEGDDQCSYGDLFSTAKRMIQGPCYVFFADIKAGEVFTSAQGAGFDLHTLIIWHKLNATYAAMNAHYKLRHELILYCKPQGATLLWCGRSDECTVWEEKRDPSNNYHPTQKPVALPSRAMRNHTAQTIVDPFLGSGSTLIAAEQLDRICHGIEISPQYCDVVVERWEALTGGQAKRHSG